MGILLIVSLHNLNAFLNWKLEGFVVFGILGIFQFEKKLSNFAPIPHQRLGQNEKQHLKDGRNIASIGQVLEANRLVADQRRHFLAHRVASRVMGPVCGIRCISIHAYCLITLIITKIVPHIHSNYKLR